MGNPELRVSLDPLNPGQFFACCGLFELMSFAEPNLQAYFALESKRPRIASFNLQNVRGQDGLSDVLTGLKGAAYRFDAAGTEEIGAATKPAVIQYGQRTLILDWWLDCFRVGTENIKCWAGQVTTRRLFEELPPLLNPGINGNILFETPALTTSLFGIDPRSAWNSLDLGFSPNEHGMDSRIYPAVEILGAVGLQYFRPNSTKRSAVPYSLWTDPLPASIARLAFAAPWDGLGARRYEFQIAKRGQSYKYFSLAAEPNRKEKIHEYRTI